MDAELIERLDRIDQKLDYIVERQRFFEDFVREMTPVGREALTAMAGRMAEWEQRGLFAMGGELMVLFERVTTAYGPQDVALLSERVVQILDTVRNVTQPDVLEMANEATDVLHHAEDVGPVGPFGMARAARDPDVQRGLAIALEVLRHLGRPHEHGAVPAVRNEPAPQREEVEEKACPPSEIIEWEGRRFSPDGFLLDTAQWDDALAVKMAAGLGVTLQDDHWTVLRWARADYLETGASPNVRRMAAGSGIGVRRMYELFPHTPGKSAAMVAGIPKPVGCV